MTTRARRGSRWDWPIFSQALTMRSLAAATPSVQHRDEDDAVGLGGSELGTLSGAEATEPDGGGLP